MQVLTWESGILSGQENMAWDDCLLDWVCGQSEPWMLVRTYRWRQATWSWGQHQRLGDARRLRVGETLEAVDWVRRPTGGRAILHGPPAETGRHGLQPEAASIQSLQSAGEDISFAFITNDPALLRASLSESYAVMSAWVKHALTGLGIAVEDSDEASGKAYTLSAACFETKTPSDILSPTGQKLAGCAQARRTGGILQHGAAFIETPLRASGRDFSDFLFSEFSSALFAAVGEAYGQPARQPVDALLSDADLRQAVARRVDALCLERDEAFQAVLS